MWNPRWTIRWHSWYCLGIPLLIFYFVLSPISSIGYWQMPASLTGITTPLTWGAYPHLLGLGPLWFVALLLIFDVGYAAWRMLTETRTPSSTREPSTPSYLGIGSFILGLALVSYLVRIIVPMGREVLDFPTLAYLPQYLSFFVLGAIAFRHNWLRTMPRPMGVLGVVTALVATGLLIALALGLLTGNVAAFLLGGLGFGFIAIAIARYAAGEW